MRLIRRQTLLRALIAVAMGFLSAESFAQQPVKPLSARPVSDGLSPRAGSVDPLLQQLDQAISVTSSRFLTADGPTPHSPWQIFHGILALKQDFQLKLVEGGKIRAIDWIANAEPSFDNKPLIFKTPQGVKFHSFTRKWAFEGHPAQFMALLSQCELPEDFSFKVAGERATMADMVRNIKWEVNANEEVTWVLWALQHYLNPSDQWLNQHQEAWSIERLVQIETGLPVVGAACGGNHRLFALTRTRDKYLKAGGKLAGIWSQADLKIRQHIELARSLQNGDGSFSSKSYRSVGYTDDPNERFNTTGHTMEFLSIAVPDNRISEPWVRNAVSMLCRELVIHRQRQIDCGPLYHTLNSVILYRDRLRALSSPRTPATIAIKPPELIKIATTPKKEVEPKVETKGTEPPSGPVKTESSDNPSDAIKLNPLEKPQPTQPASPVTESLRANESDVISSTDVLRSDQRGLKTEIPAATAPLEAKLKALNPGRALQTRRVVRSVDVSRPALLPQIDAVPISQGVKDPVDLGVSLDESFQMSAQSFKPSLSRDSAGSRSPRRIDSRDPSPALPIWPLLTPVDDDAVSALRLANP